MSLESLGVSWDQARGQVSLHGDALAFVKDLDSIFQAWAKAESAVEFQFPSFVAAKDLKRLDYFKSFPHLATFPISLEASEANLRAFSQSENVDEEGKIRFSELDSVAEVLTPAACYHFYIELQGQKLEKTRFYTTKCTCFRREDYYERLRRQWNFSMREIVCVGESSDVESFTARMQKRIESFCASIELPVRWESATDPFFNPTENPKYLMQKLDPVKNELIYGNDLAIASTNLHRNYFGDAFEIKCKGLDAFSGCAAFGVERWLAAVVDHFGVEPSAWPKLKGFL